MRGGDVLGVKDLNYRLTRILPLAKKINDGTNLIMTVAIEEAWTVCPPEDALFCFVPVVSEVIGDRSQIISRRQVPTELP